MAMTVTEETDRAAAGKSQSAYRTISEVSEELGVPQHVLRFWESRFGQLRPLKRAGGRRYYRPEDIDLLRRIHTLLHRDGYTIKGVQRLLRGAKGEEEGDGEDEVALGPPEAPPEPTASTLTVAHRRELESLLAELKDLRRAVTAT